MNMAISKHFSIIFLYFTFSKVLNFRKGTKSHNYLLPFGCCLQYEQLRNHFQKIIYLSFCFFKKTTIGTSNILFTFVLPN